MTEFTQESPCLEGVCEKLSDTEYRTSAPKVEALLRVSYQLYGNYSDLLPKSMPMRSCGCGPATILPSV